jgi:endoglucanase
MNRRDMLRLSLAGLAGWASPGFAMDSRDAHRIVANQLGFSFASVKRALLVGPPLDGSSAEIINLATGATTLRVPLGPPLRDMDSGDVLRVIDFSPLAVSGNYRVRVEDIVSLPFPVADAPYANLQALLLDAFALQRCGVAVRDAASGIDHPPCHVHDGVLRRPDAEHPFGAATIHAAGGWHDAGDFGKYVATTAVSLGRMLSLMVFAAPTGVSLPQLRAECRVGLEWLLTMQRADGAFYRKLSGARWPAPIRPELDDQPRFVYGISSADSAKAAAALALAGRTFASTEPADAERYLLSAQRAWSWLAHNPRTFTDWQVDDDAGSGKYMLSRIDRETSLTTDEDDRLWAAAELLLATGDPVYEQWLHAHPLYLGVFDLFEWKNPASLGVAHLIFAPGGSPSLKEPMRVALLRRADELVRTVNAGGWRLANTRLVWGSNKMAAEEGVTLVYAFLATGRRAYLDAAQDQVDFLLGRNPFGLVFVTGAGGNHVSHPAHLYSRAANLAIPGLFVGGANEDAQDSIAPARRRLRSYIDDDRSYATNEFAIDYNASLIGLIGMLEHARMPGRAAY